LIDSIKEFRFPLRIHAQVKTRRRDLFMTQGMFSASRRHYVFLPAIGRFLRPPATFLSFAHSFDLGFLQHAGWSGTRGAFAYQIQSCAIYYPARSHAGLSSDGNGCLNGLPHFQLFFNWGDVFLMLTFTANPTKTPVGGQRRPFSVNAWAPRCSNVIMTPLGHSVGRSHRSACRPPRFSCAMRPAGLQSIPAATDPQSCPTASLLASQGMFCCLEIFREFGQFHNCRRAVEPGGHSLNELIDHGCRATKDKPRNFRRSS